jgi:DNA-binding PadR family transcriptional regulator
MSDKISAAMLHILLALAAGKRHGYGIAQEAEAVSNGRVKLGPATLYTTLQHLLELDWISTAGAPAGVDERRKYYRLTAAGRHALEEEVERMEAVVRKARTIRAKPLPSR